MSGSPILSELMDAAENRRPAVLATVIHTGGSVPRRSGAKMIVYGDRSTSGTVGGGTMEASVVDDAMECLQTSRTKRVSYSLIDPASGDPGVCGGTVELYLEPYMPPSTIYVIGVGHVGQAVVELASWLGHRVVAWDDRPELSEGVDSSVTGLTGTIEEALATEPIDAQTSVIVVTRSVDLDLEIFPLLLATPASYIGLMGSKRRWKLTRSKLSDLGVVEDQLDRVQSPIGVEISAETPSEIAVSILAEVIASARAS